MPKNFKLTLITIVMFCSLLTSQIQAKPTVVVSIEPLYEITAALLKGVTEPHVLINNDKLDKQLSSAQIKQLLSADMLIRIGDGIEPRLGESLSQELALVNGYTVTLSNYMPLLPKSKQPSESDKSVLSERQKSYDLRFWMDPKLLSMAVRYITPQLVRMDPEHQEQYLENEIVLLMQIKKFSKLTAQFIQKMSDTEKTLIALANPYLAHRYIQDEAIINQVKSSDISKTICIKNEALALKSFSLSTENLESSITQLVRELSSCQSRTIAARE